MYIYHVYLNNYVQSVVESLQFVIMETFRVNYVLRNTNRNEINSSRYSFANMYHFLVLLIQYVYINV